MSTSLTAAPTSRRGSRPRRPLPAGFAPVKDFQRQLLNSFQQARSVSLSQYAGVHLVEPSRAGAELAALVDAVIDGRPAVCRADSDGFTLLVGGATLNFTQDCVTLLSYSPPSRSAFNSPRRTA